MIPNSPNQGQKICPKCQNLNPIAAQSCWSCGHIFRTQFQQPQQPDPTMMFQAQPGSPPPQPQYNQVPGATPNYVQLPKNTHSPGLAVLFSFLCLPAGQIYNRQALKGVLMLLVAMPLSVITAGLALIVVFPVVLIDAYMIAAKLQQGRPVGTFEFF